MFTNYKEIENYSQAENNYQDQNFNCCSIEHDFGGQNSVNADFEFLISKFSDIDLVLQKEVAYDLFYRLTTNFPFEILLNFQQFKQLLMVLKDLEVCKDLNLKFIFSEHSLFILKLTLITYNETKDDTLIKNLHITLLFELIKTQDKKYLHRLIQLYIKLNFSSEKQICFNYLMLLTEEFQLSEKISISILTFVSEIILEFSHQIFDIFGEYFVNFSVKNIFTIQNEKNTIELVSYVMCCLAKFQMDEFYEFMPFNYLIIFLNMCKSDTYSEYNISNLLILIYSKENYLKVKSIINEMVSFIVKLNSRTLCFSSKNLGFDLMCELSYSILPDKSILPSHKIDIIQSFNNNPINEDNLDFYLNLYLNLIDDPIIIQNQIVTDSIINFLSQNYEILDEDTISEFESKYQIHPDS